jgi:hypothetical protein
VVAKAAAGRAAPATVETVVGLVTVEARPGAKKVAAAAGMSLPEGAMVTTGRTGRVFIRFGKTDLIRLRGDSQIWIAQLKGSKPTRTSTLIQLVTGTLRAMLNRTEAEKTQNFAVAAGSTICAVKGTMFDMLAPAAGAIAGKVEVRCDDGGVGVGIIKADVDLGMLDLAATPTRILKAGYQVSASAVTGKIELARRAPPRTTLEVVGGTGRVTAVVGAKSVELLPGDEVPAGAKVTVAGGSAILAGTRSAVQAGDGSAFKYDAKVEDVKGAPPTVTSVVTVTAGSAVVDAGGRTEIVRVGMSGVVSGAGLLASMPAAQAQAVLNPPPPGTSPAGTHAATAPKPEPVSTQAGPTYAPEDVLPELPSLPPDTSGGVTPPASTPSKDAETVTPPGSGDEQPVSPSAPTH